MIAKSKPLRFFSGALVYSYDGLLMFHVFAVFLLAFFAPVLQWTGAETAQWIYRSLSATCHQDPSRSQWIFGFTVGVCSRCFGIYLGLIVMRLYMGFRTGKFLNYHSSLFSGRTQTILAFALMALMILEWNISRIQPDLSVNMTRYLTGFAFGAGFMMLHRMILARIKK